MRRPPKAAATGDGGEPKQKRSRKPAACAPSGFSSRTPCPPGLCCWERQRRTTGESARAWREAARRLTSLLVDSTQCKEGWRRGCRSGGERLSRHCHSQRPSFSVERPVLLRAHFPGLRRTAGMPGQVEPGRAARGLQQPRAKRTRSSRRRLQSLQVQLAEGAPQLRCRQQRSRLRPKRTTTTSRRTCSSAASAGGCSAGLVSLIARL